MTDKKIGQGWEALKKRMVNDSNPSPEAFSYNPEVWIDTVNKIPSEMIKEQHLKFKLNLTTANGEAPARMTGHVGIDVNFISRGVVNDNGAYDFGDFAVAAGMVKYGTDDYEAVLSCGKLHLIKTGFTGPGGEAFRLIHRRTDKDKTLVKRSSEQFNVSDLVPDSDSEKKGCYYQDKDNKNPKLCFPAKSESLLKAFTWERRRWENISDLTASEYKNYVDWYVMEIPMKNFSKRQGLEGGGNAGVSTNCKQSVEACGGNPSCEGVSWNSEKPEDPCRYLTHYDRTQDDNTVWKSHSDLSNFWSHLPKTSER